MRQRPRRGKRGICFSAEPQVHEYEIDSPSSRRLEVRRKVSNPASIKFDLFKIELEARGIDPKLKTSKKRLLECFNTELRGDLEKVGISGATGTNEELSAMLELATFLRRRANLRNSGIACVCDGATPKMPVDMYVEELDQQLADRKILVTEKGRKARIVALEEALLKESEVLIGDGFDFGRRFVKVEDMLSLEEYSDKELRDEIKSRGMKAPRKKQEKLELLYKIVEDDLESQVRACFHEELLDELVRLGVSAANNSNSAPSTEVLADKTHMLRDAANKVSPPRAAMAASTSVGDGKSTPLSTRKRKRTSVEDTTTSSPHEALRQEENQEEMLETPAKRMRRFAEASLQRAGWGTVFKTASPSPAEAAELATSAREALESLETNALFDLLFRSGKWREDYREPPCEVKQGSCVLQ
ncbi:Hypothetical Protein FCC1311_030502 [Hondaea fermentalgiana]|uniref:Uncharacterized protein n=1 Tax=Hondaea fermentalgiana TaxID=2315210 RepID=A0A2R5GAR7_9STRA|nr:Hypothetical Protein FCC1311_030502 [Hondaea fermentalgiana]|eukprot:GBG26828.1 Hypothetical Protein FCC1311_030502 [Hondaea fermentalgiana]